MCLPYRRAYNCIRGGKVKCTVKLLPRYSFYLKTMTKYKTDLSWKKSTFSCLTVCEYKNKVVENIEILVFISTRISQCSDAKCTFP